MHHGSQCMRSTDKGIWKYSKTLLAMMVAGVLPLAHAAYPGQSVGIEAIETPVGTTSIDVHKINGAGNVLVGMVTISNKAHAVRWVNGTGWMYLDEAGNFANSAATGVNVVGNVIVGAVDAGNSKTLAFRWVEGQGMTLLGTLTGMRDSFAFAVNAAGNVVVGGSGQNGVNSAFRWVEGRGMEDLGSLIDPLSIPTLLPMIVASVSPSVSSQATGVNAEGNVVIGNVTDSGVDYAFRWVEGQGMSYLGRNTPDVQDMRANAINASGNVVVGGYYDNNGDGIAYRWTEAGGIESLEVPAGSSDAAALGVNAAGDVVVGEVSGATNSIPSGFRWTQETGMQTIEQWLEANDIDVSGMTSQTQDAKTVNAEGNVVAGKLRDGKSYIARVSSSGANGLINVEEFNAGLGRVGASTMLAENNTDLVLNGMHSNPMQMLLKTGQSAFWVGGDLGRQDKEARRSDMAIGEIGYGYRLNDTIQFNLAAGHSFSQTDTDFNGRTRVQSNFVLPELVVTLPGSLYATVSAFYAKGKLNIDRGYLNAGTAQLSKGDPGVETVGARVRVDWHNMATLGGAALTPYTTLTYTHTKIDGYTEQGGGFPVRWDARKADSTTVRVGLDLVKPVSDAVKLQGRLEGAHRFEKNTVGASGEILGLNGFGFAGQRLKQNWLRVGLGVEGKVGSGVASAMLNATTESETAAYWLAVNYRWAF